MKNSQVISNEGFNMSHKIPIAWKKGDIRPHKLSSQINSLIKLLSVNNYTSDQIIHLRQSNIFFDIYKAIHKELEEGTGVIYLPRVNIGASFNKKQRELLFLQFCQFIGTPVPINKAGEIIREVKNQGEKDSIVKPVRGHLTNQELAFHSDRADITIMLCESTAASGGEFKICSSASLYYKLQEYPDVLGLLAMDIPHDLRDEGAGLNDMCYHPIISYKDIFWVRYIRKFINSSVRHGITIDHKTENALDCVDNIINNKNFYHEILFDPNDIIMFNNHLTLHSRNAFIDSKVQQRCLLRVWLSSEFSRELPESMTPIFHSVKAGSFRGGLK